MDTEIKWCCKSFADLDVLTFHNIIQLRIDVFVIEQRCAYRDLDNKDLKSHHVYGLNSKNEVIAHARLLPKGVSYEFLSIGRVVVHPDYRKFGIGHQLMNYCMAQMKAVFGDDIIKISAQAHLQKFYNEHNFITITEEYMEDGIPHVGMLYTPQE